MVRQSRRSGRVKRWLCGLLVLAAAVAVMAAAAAFYVWSIDQRITRIEADTSAGFHWPYYLYVPDAVAERGGQAHLLVLPNNTGHPDDDFSVHERAAYLRMLRDSRLAEELEVAALVPIFPRPADNWRVYTHALDRDCLTTTLEDLTRLDLQLGAMIDDARGRLADRGLSVEPRVLLKGFSANGMFVNRFTLLHPERVLAVAAGSPGGWPLAPVAEWNGRRLRYPVGVADLEELTGRPFDAETFAEVPVMIFMGEQDENDSVPFGDGYDDQDRDIVNELFGQTPVSRWDTSAEIHASVSERADFRLYPGVGHETTSAMAADVAAFLRAALSR